jgi:all-trans-retinol dehydrogenase (NAD+)
MYSLKGKTAIVTGGAMGIGLQTCRRLLREDCLVSIWDYNADELKRVSQSLAPKPGRLFTQVCDVSDRQRVEELVKQARQQMGRVDILINNAAFVRHGMFWDQPIENATRQMEVNVNALFYAIHAVLPEMMERNAGHIVNVSSGAAFVSGPGLAAYTASKWAVWGLTDVLRLEVMGAGKTGIRFTSVHPGNILTGMFEGFKLNAIGKRMIPPVKDHDDIARRIVENGLKRGKHLVIHPWQLRIPLMLRGWLPDTWMARLSLLSGAADCVRDYRGRKGLAHSDATMDALPPANPQP